MKARFILVPLAAVVAVGGTLIFHPGVAAANPRFLSLKPSSKAINANYSLDENHADISFEVQHMQLSRVRGRFNKFTGTVHLVDKNPAKSSVEVSIDAASVDTAIPARDEHLRTKDFFDVEKYKKITFKSTSVVRNRLGYTVTGDFSMHGKTKRISIPFKFYGPYVMKTPDGNIETIGVIASPIKLKRSDFGMVGVEKLPDGVVPLSNEIVVNLSFEAEKK